MKSKQVDKTKQLGRIGAIAIEVKSTSKPWTEGLDDSVVVLASGIRGSMRGTFARFWRDELKEGRDVLAQISERLSKTLRVEPERPAWMVIPLEVGGESRECNICVATAFDRNGVHLGNVRRAVLAVAAEAARRNVRRMAVPLLGSGGGGLSPALVVRRELEAVVAHAQREGDGLEKITILVRYPDFENIANAAATFMTGKSGAEKWYDAIKKQGAFTEINVLEDLQGGYSGARLDVCEVIDTHGAQLPLTVFKIGPKNVIDQEARAAKAAHALLGEYAVGVSDKYALDRKSSALRMPLAGEDHSGQPAMSYLRFFKESGDPHEVAKALTVLFGPATQRMYGSADVRWCRLWDLREGMERTRGERYWVEAAMGFAGLLLNTSGGSRNGGPRVGLGYPVEDTIDDPFHPESPLARGWDRRLEAPMAKTTHGDLNPRNVVMVRTTSNGGFTPRILDFYRFGNVGPLATDFARFEAGVHIKCLEEQIRDRGFEAARELRLYEDWVTSRFAPLVTGSLVRSVAPQFTKAVFAVNAIRERYVAASTLEDRRCYWMCLSLSLLSYLRPVYDGRLSDGQRLFATFMAANILDRRVLRES